MKWILFLFSLIKDEGDHFLLAFTLGVLGYALISIIFYVSCWVWERFTRKKVSTAVDFFILILCLSAGFSLALLSHSWLDGLLLWYVTPLGPSLQINLP